MAHHEALEKIYRDPRHPAGYSNPTVLFHYARDNGITKKEVEEFLQKEESYTLHRQSRKHFKRNRIQVGDIDEQWEIDLADLPSLTQQNEGYRYIFCCIDVLSKYAWVLALKRKTGPVLVEALRKTIDSSGRKPRQIRADKGGEFVNHQFKAFCKEQGIHFFVSQNETKAAIVERFQRTLKGYMWRFFTKSGSHRYIDNLDDFVFAYNHRKHRSIKHRPVDVTPLNSHKVWKILYQKTSKKKPKYKFDIGEKVRISKTKCIFEKGYQQNLRQEFFTITRRM